ncbi:MAG: bifunctional riboflavin kinase/FAD synthetase [Chitinophagaceae bacterium]|jgi:riboflavin kinase/FMN adenylyltransferase|nr:bifunctional riboflavin kinase/FAD synthetase [Chitinophagaceae bacterium]
MQVHRYTDQLPPFRNAVITIGTFDGVHSGHLQIIHQLKEAAKTAQGESVIITFHPHPRRVVGGQQNDIRLLNSLVEKIELLDKNGIDHLVIVPFTEAFSRLSAIEYIEEFLVRHFQPHTIIIGYDHHFGHNREGNYTLLEAFKQKHGYRIVEITEKVQNNVTISSTKIRQALLNGNVCDANEFLGYPYFLEGTIVGGKKLGRTIGYPTANIRLSDEEKLVPANGVYAVKASLIVRKNGGYDLPLSQSSLISGMMNIGVRPTVDGTTRTIEVNLFDFDKEIYGETIRVSFFKRLRGEIRFEGLEALKAQLALDKEQSILALDEIKKVEGF